MVEGGVSSSTIGSGAWEYIVVVFEPRDTDPIRGRSEAPRRERPRLEWLPTMRPAPTPVTARGIIFGTIQDYPLVRDAAMTQDGNQVSLVLIVDYAIDPDYARQLGDNFVRLAKSFLKDDPPGKAIGRGKYDYLIRVYYPNEKRLALGAKSRVSDRISW